ncbi:malto-oligosyltrehalose trehalohydrolase [Ectothiorhodospira mobilis]|uniref:malto-oligosyltrehalose trehalohydrolase n=1 Tax=Ectothiorhodospira mobilis TaxID=195064 RepID=UPI001EE78F65|nr:malto-oligosyltrehalose trehalohydrolase [Ectothiorhodospira mobilis]MCG5536652.1 malto-oligosyltrehalose trehalohydrolase [Ectothiorhodospira mobilis]
MRPLRVWAPRAGRLTLETAAGRRPMVRGDNGTWRVRAPELVHGADYALWVDGEGPFPDPRSPWQPRGVHGPSRVVDHGRFPWRDAGWRAPPLASAVIQEIHVGTFTPEGTFDAAIGRLDHLLDLGITHVELMPVAAFPGTRGWGYDGVALFAPHAPYGGPDGLKRLVDACHRRGLAVLLDVVYNHLGPDGNHLARFGPYFTDAYRTPWGDAVNLDGPDSPEVRRFFLDNARMWLQDYHLDGLRLDAVHALMDRSAVHLLEALSRQTRHLEARLGRPLVLIAESDLNDPRIVRPPQAGGLGLDAQWNEDFHHALHALLTGERQGYYADYGGPEALARVLTAGFWLEGQYSQYRRRYHGRSAAGLAGRAFVACLQNHDQVGNRAEGERSAHLLSEGLLRVGAALVLTAPFVPLLFQGEEWGARTPFIYFTDHQDPALARAVAEGRRREFAAFGWDAALIPDPQSLDTFRRCLLDWDEPGRAPHAGLLAWHRDLIALRRRLPDLTDDRLERVRVRFDAAAHTWVMNRGAVTVACNLGPVDADLALPAQETGRPLLCSTAGIRAGAAGVHLPAASVVVLGRPSRAGEGDECA